jgi:hypothetical protein
MTPTEFAALINGRQYRHEVTRAESAMAKCHGLVVIYGASDDLLEFEGAISEELGAYDGTTARIGQYGVLKEFEELRGSMEDEADFEAYFRRKASGFAIVKAVWCPTKDETSDPWASWSIETEVPHATFDIMEDGELFCRGVVLRLADLPGAPS